ncbi:hypothetical protein RMAECT_0535 [Rickettsia rhipicephali str. Ect]|uniref:Uncharacterized protein n=1 Tax=Rickettsia rhipicephali str. Ect TaxID=1359199 RepID=A0A0F3PEG7_RICRH|nr:hypothetical protein RMAECT_0535 [Rickettsia rhipicephali str. Ect]
MRGNYKVIDEAISGVCYYCMRLPSSLLLSVACNDGLVSTRAISPRNDDKVKPRYNSLSSPQSHF